jgi:hypothetical protein
MRLQMNWKHSTSNGVGASASISARGGWQFAYRIPPSSKVIALARVHADRLHVAAAALARAHEPGDRVLFLRGVAGQRVGDVRAGRRCGRRGRSGRRGACACRSSGPGRARTRDAGRRGGASWGRCAIIVLLRLLRRLDEREVLGCRATCSRRRPPIVTAFSCVGAERSATCSRSQSAWPLYLALRRAPVGPRSARPSGGAAVLVVAGAMPTSSQLVVVAGVAVRASSFSTSAGSTPVGALRAGGARGAAGRATTFQSSSSASGISGSVLPGARTAGCRRPSGTAGRCPGGSWAGARPGPCCPARSRSGARIRGRSPPCRCSRSSAGTRPA